MTLGLPLTAGGYAVALAIVVAEARRRNTATYGMALVAGVGLLGGLLGARLSHWLLEGRAFWQAHPSAIFDPRYGGRTILGGVACGWLAVVLAKRYLGITRSTGDGWALALSAGEAVGRLGCCCNGCCYGAACQLPWAVYQWGAWRHPSQLYMAAWAAMMTAILYAVRPKLKREGDLFAAYLLLFGLGRFVVEFTRERTLGWLGVSDGQWAALALALAGVVVLARSRHRAQAPPPSA